MCPLEWEAYVDECSDSLDAVVVLCVVQEEPLAGLVRRVPFENIKLRCSCGIVLGR